MDADCASTSALEERRRGREPVEKASPSAPLASTRVYGSSGSLAPPGHPKFSPLAHSINICVTQDARERIYGRKLQDDIDLPG